MPVCKTSVLARKEERDFLLFSSPWWIGLALFVIGPMIASVIISFTQWDIITPPKWVGLRNYLRLFRDDPLFWKSLRVTAVYTFVLVPLQLALSLAVSVLLNQKVKFLGLFRTIFYLPTVLPVVASALLWLWILNPEGILNFFVGLLGIPRQNWLTDERLALPSIMLMSLWGSFGTSMVIFLAGLQGVSPSLYDAARIDGAGSWACFRHVTLPMISPVLFFNFVMGVIGTFQVFTQGYLLTDGRPNNSTLFYVLYLYRSGFEYLKMGYASAMAWVLFVIILAVTLLILRSSSLWVYYEVQR
ncbi:MAG: sugar ABC transporter permease [candidate division KSB1 bacterium]|nr:sugar ABC transporter permease [candidate division KSB1 bacterium]